MEDTRFGVAATSAPSPSRYPNHLLPSLRDAPHDARTPLYAIAKPNVSAIATRGVRVKRRSAAPTTRGDDMYTNRYPDITSLDNLREHLEAYPTEQKKLVIFAAIFNNAQGLLPKDGTSE